MLAASIQKVNGVLIIVVLNINHTSVRATSRTMCASGFVVTRMQWVLGAPGGFLCNVYTHTYNVLQRAVGPARHTHRQHSDRCIVLVGV